MRNLSNIPACTARWEERQKARQEEIQACSEALAILSSDDAHDTFTKTFNFVQVKQESKRDQAAKVLFAAAKKSRGKTWRDFFVARLTPDAACVVHFSSTECSY